MIISSPKIFYRHEVFFSLNKTLSEWNPDLFIISYYTIWTEILWKSDLSSVLHKSISVTIMSHKVYRYRIYILYVLVGVDVYRHSQCMILFKWFNRVCFILSFTDLFLLSSITDSSPTQGSLPTWTLPKTYFPRRNKGFVKVPGTRGLIVRVCGTRDRKSQKN